MNEIDQAIAKLIPGEHGWGMLAGMLLGAMTGAAVALLIPQGGRAASEQLRERGLEMKDRAAELLRIRRAPL
jgi:gas vesicle protein